MKRIGILTSGGDAPGMNAAIRAVVRCGIAAGFEVYGFHRGYEGLLEGDAIWMERSDVGDILHRGGTILKTARSRRFMEPGGLEKALQTIGNMRLDGLVIIGGNGTLQGACKLVNAGIPVMFLPGTIDNDLSYTEKTIGFDTAVNTVLDAISKIRDTSSAHERVTIVEVMGRDCGDIALYSGMGGGAEVVLTPEYMPRLPYVYNKILAGLNRGKLHSIIINAEGSGVSSEELEAGIEAHTGKETRTVVLSYLQRGGSPSADDRILATLCGAKAVELLQAGEKGCAIGERGGKVFSMDIFEAEKCTREPDLSLYELTEVLSM
jgi:6-phosphofructokinase 1